MGDSGVYAIKHIDSGRIYVGSAVNFSNRWRVHKSALNRNKHHSPQLQNAWNKYGESAFELVVLLRCEPFELMRYEQHFLDMYSPFYNCAKKAYSMLGVKRSPETCAKIGDAKRGKPRPDIKPGYISSEGRARLSALKKGKPFPHKGHSFSEETRERFRLMFTGKKLGSFTDEHKTKISVARTGYRVPEESRARMKKAAKERERTKALKRKCNQLSLL